MEGLSFSPLDHQLDKNLSALPGTCKWFFNHLEYQTWLKESHSSLLWVTGKPGCGKTVLLSYVGKYLAQRRQIETITVSWFCDSATRTTTSAFQILVVIIFAALSRRRRTSNVRLRQTLASIKADTPTKIFPSTIRHHLRVIMDSLMSDEKLFLILDGIDEGDGSERLILDEIYFASKQKKQPQLKCMFSSRPRPDNHLWATCVSKIDLNEEREVQYDLHAFATSKVNMLIQKIPRIGIYRLELLDKLCSGAGGMFLGARLISDYLVNHNMFGGSVGIDLIRSIAVSLEEFYDEMLWMVSQRNGCAARNLFQWVLCARRPLHILELKAALATKDATEQVESSREKNLGLLYTDEDILRMSSGLIVISETRNVRFAHTSIKEHLLSRKFTRIDHLQAHSIIARTCITYLSYHDFKRVDDSTKPQSISELDQQPPFWRYAIDYWTVHYQLGESQSNSLPGLLHHALLSEKTGIVTTLSDLGFLNASDFLDDPLGTTLRMCSRYGFKHLGKVYIEMGADPSGTSLVPRLTPLQLASANGHLETAKMLLTMGGRFDHEAGRSGESPLYLAAKHGYREIVALLISHGADINTRSDCGVTPLHAAIAGSRLEVVDLLIEKGADVNVATYDTRETPIHWAASLGDIEGLLYLLRGSHDREPLDGAYRYRSSLKSYYSSGYKVAGSELETFPEAEGPPLQNQDIRHRTNIEMLRGDLEMQDENGWTALHKAVVAGHVEIVRILLEMGAKARTFDRWRKTPLDRASESGHENIVELLVKMNAQFFEGVSYSEDPKARSPSGSMTRQLQDLAFMTPKNSDTFNCQNLQDERGELQPGIFQDTTKSWTQRDSIRNRILAEQRAELGAIVIREVNDCRSENIDEWTLL